MCRMSCNLFYTVPFRIAVFSVSVLHDERIVVVAEQRPDASEEDSFQWMSRVLQVLFIIIISDVCIERPVCRSSAS